MRFIKEDRISEPATAEDKANRAQLISRFYADLVQTSGVRWADGTGPSATAGKEAAGHIEEARLRATDQALERASVTPAGVVVLDPAGSRATDTAGDRDQSFPATGFQAAGGVQYGISKHNVGYQLLRKAGWKEGTGLGAQQQGRRQPLAPAAVQGQVGLGFQVTTVARRGPAQPTRRQGEKKEQGGEATHEPKQLQQTAAPKRPLPPDPLEKEEVEVKVKRLKQVMQAEADEKAGKTIQRYMYMAFNDATGEPTNDSNPLLRKGRSKLSATNPLL